MNTEQQIRKILEDNDAFENDDTHLWVNCNWDTIVKCMKEYAAITHLQAKGERLFKAVDVNERLPENGATVLWEYRGGGYKEGRYQREGEDNYIYFDETALNNRKHVMMCDAFTHWLEEIPAPAPENEAAGWISVEDKLPEMINEYQLMKTSAYIMYANQYGIYIGWCGIFTVDCTGNGWSKGDVYFTGLGRNKEKATHWRYLPAPPPTTVHPL